MVKLAWIGSALNQVTAGKSKQKVYHEHESLQAKFEKIMQ